MVYYPLYCFILVVVFLSVILVYSLSVSGITCNYAVLDKITTKTSGFIYTLAPYPLYCSILVVVLALIYV